ncbi:MAG: hydrogenase maturation protease [Methylococcales bacterium]|nr:hydrogenase maturation protease [Methylococcales bacterium]
MRKPLLVIACGNPSRGDDALGPLLLDFIERQADLSAVELLSDFQLQIEHALDLQNRELVLFADATVSANAAFRLEEIRAEQDRSYTSHAMSPAAVLQVYHNTIGPMPPPCFLLSIQGTNFELGEQLSANAQHNLQLACRFTRLLLAEPTAECWRRQIGRG